jgi:hypothetical protein
VKHLGFDHFTVYDLDGSAERHLAPLLNSTFLTYISRWNPIPCLANLTATGARPYCTQTLVENQCVWNSRGAAEWAMLVHAPDCFLNDAPGLPTMFGLLDAMDHSKATLLLPTVLFAAAHGAPNPEGGQSSTAPDVFSVFNSRVCALLNCYRHMPVLDPHLTHVTAVHFALADSQETRTYTAALAVNHYVQMFSNRLSREVAAYTDDGMYRHPNGSHDFCFDDRLAHVTGIMTELLKTFTNDHK